MVFPVVGGTQDTGYEISNSLRFNDDDSAKLGITFGSGGNRKTYTISFWVKRGHITAQQNIFGTPSEGDTLYFDGGDRLRFFQNGSASSYLGTNRLFRDPSAWYHIVVAVDTNQSTSTNRVKLYINGSQYTWDASTTYPAEDYEGDFNHTADEHMIGNGHHGNSFDGYISEFYFIDGTQYAASDFGETNNNGVWIPKAFTGTFGSNGFLCEFKQTGTSANASGMGADTSGNGNHLTPTNLNAYDVVPDTPTNNYCVLNPADKDGHTNAEGNLEVSGNVIYGMQRGTIGATSGKWYFEARLNTYQGDTAIALANEDENIFTRFSGETTNSVGYLADNRFFYNSGATNYSSLTAGNIFQIAFDADTGKIWIGKNNTWQNSGDPANGTGSVQTVSWNFFLPAARTVGSGVLHYNFGQDSSFGGHSTAQNNADGNGYGDFYYAPPTGFFALNTKNLAEYG